MGLRGGFLEWGRVTAPHRDRRERLGDYSEVELPQALDVVEQQGARCMDCGIPFCHQGCPLGNLIPDFNDLVYRGQWREAYLRLTETNDFPEFTGRLCPAPCEAACVLAINDDPVAIEHVEREIIERAFAEGWVVPRPPETRTGRHVAVVGSGPAGLAAAAGLNSAGHFVTIYEAADRLGGLLRYGIPDFKMEKHVIDRRLAVLAAEGVRFETGVQVGVDVRWPDLHAQHDAVVLALGARRARDLAVPGRELAGVHLAMDYLDQQNRVVAGDDVDAPARIDAAGARVLILGGGDTGSDCLGTALRQGAAEVQQIELMPRPAEGRGESNPWPEWPLVLRTSTSQAEGGERRWGLLTKRLEGEGGALRRLHAVRVGVNRDGGRLRLVEEPESETVIEVDTLILAMGFMGPELGPLADQLGVALDARGNVAVDEAFRTNVEGLYAAGDVVRGASLIVWAISQGREAARAVDAYLREGEPALPTRGEDMPWTLSRRA